MSWEDSDALASRLKRSLDAFNWKEAENICDEIINRVKTDSELFPEISAKRLLTNLRRKRRFELVTRVAEALLQSGLSTALIRRQYAQALIDQGILAAAEALLRFSLLQADIDAMELTEAHGLLGRVYKQLYVNNPTSPSNLQRAIKEYFETYNLDPTKNLWHGINVVACLLRAQRDKQQVGEWPDPLVLARDILEVLYGQERVSALQVWDLATKMEAYVAIGEYQKATTTALKYITHKDADAFELKSTLRQLTEVWQLTDKKPPGKHLLPILRAGHLRQEGATAQGDFKAVIAEAIATAEAVKDCNTIVDEDTTEPLQWYKTALDQCRAIARVETVGGKSLGTGWLVNANDFFPKMTGVLLLTNEHLISNDREHSHGVRPEEAQANFESHGKICKLKKIIWSSPYQKLDASFVSLEETPDAAPLRLSSETTFDPSTRFCIISQDPGTLTSGSPNISVQDTYLLAQNESVFHYRTPEEGICSGSPVFESEDWRVVALHHASNAVMPRIDGREGTYEASEGISIAAIRRAVQAPPEVFRSSSKGIGFRGVEKTSEPSKASFRITLEGDAVANSAVKYGTNVDLVFEYVAPEFEVNVERTQKLQVPLGIMVVPLGFKFRQPEEKGYRHVRFYQSGANEKVRFELRASSHVVDTTPVANHPPPETGFHVIFDLRGAILRQLFVPAQLVRDLSEASGETETPPLYTFDLADLKKFDDDTVQAQQRVAVALQQVLS
ncbi:MAG TPA: serine protease [Pyrinomonadaceae bacterium]